jgi:SAM-dependent methyltransferase
MNPAPGPHTASTGGIDTRFSQAEYWQDAWVRHIDAYLAAPPRCGYWVAATFGRERPTVLEIAGGSCRDSRFLAERSWDAVGTDFEQRTLDYLRYRFPASRLRLEREDAFRLSLRDKSVDLTFHNGFWVLFRDDNKIHALLQEQARVTRKYVVALMHNAENAQLAGSFGRLSQRDSLYDIRFFHRDEIRDLVNASGLRYKSLALHKFGGRMDVFFGPHLKGLRNPLRPVARHFVPRLYPYQSWQETERIACVIELP